MITFGRQMFIEYEKEMNTSNQILKRYEEYIGGNKIKNDILDKVCGDNITEKTCSERDEIYKNNQINRFIEISNNYKRELQPNTMFLWKAISILFC